MLFALNPVVYVQISAEQVRLKNLKTGATLSVRPEMAVVRQPKHNVLAVGEQARAAAASSPAAEVINPFAHPRSLVSDFTSAQLLLQALLRQVMGKSWLTMGPRVVMHPLGSPEGGFTQVEIRAFHEMALGAGASEAFVWHGRPLTDEEVLARKPQDGGEWE